MSMTNARSDRLARYFGAIVHGGQNVNNASDFKRFLEAILDQNDHCKAVERLALSRNSMEALHHGLRFNITHTFINQYTAKFVQYLEDPKIKHLCNGLFFEQMLDVIMEPETLWNAFVVAFFSQQLDPHSVHALAWLISEVLALPTCSKADVMADAQRIVNDESISSSTSTDLRNLGHKIRYLLEMKTSASTMAVTGYSPGGRHDNDFPDFRKISILPTSDEFGCTVKPFYRRAEEVAELCGDQRVAGHLDNQFRLLREDMLCELREDFQTAIGAKKGRRSPINLGGLTLTRVSCGPESRRRIQPCALGVTCKSGLEPLLRPPQEKRKAFLMDNSQFLKHRAFGCLIRGTEIVAFATIERDIDELLRDVPVVLLRIGTEEATNKALLYLKLFADVKFLLVDAPIFAYEPILKCLQETGILPFKEELFLYEKSTPLTRSDLIPPTIINDLNGRANRDIRDILGASKAVKLDYSQLDSLVAGLTQRVSLIQGPPGTGKSLIGALLTKLFFDQTKERILVMCYTNHALDQFLEDLLDIGIDATQIVRLGSKSTPRTKPLSLAEQGASQRLSHSQWSNIRNLESDADKEKSELENSFALYQQLGSDAASIMDYLEFEDPTFYDALTVHENEDGMALVGKKGKAVKKDYLYTRWVNGQHPGVLAALIPEHCHDVWEMNKNARGEKQTSWVKALINEEASSLAARINLFNRTQKKLDTARAEKNRSLFMNKRIIGCTTTAAAMSSEDLRHIAPGILLLEEAGEILESHVLAALTPETKHLVLIGDHQQLRPKVNSYALSAEKDDGYDLNVSLFERLIRNGFPHTTLSKQHRMCPEISALVRNLAYPELEDDPKTKSRPEPRGLQDRVVFFQHRHPEVDFKNISDKRDEGAKQSKKNVSEAEIILKIVKYLGQQGYGTDKMVVLTPYLGQLHLLKETLSKQNDPVLSDLDSYDLIKAGLLSKAGASHNKRQIKLSTIDNYQGEESEVVIAPSHEVIQRVTSVSWQLQSV